MSEKLDVVDLGGGAFRVDREDRTDMVFVAGPAGDRWAFWNGRVFRADVTAGRREPSIRARRGAHVAQSLAAPMPATVVDVLVKPGDTVRKGDTVVLLEAMKMELPIRAPADGTVTAVHCAPRELVKADAVLVEME